jgi:PAS domain S-box-containing protein
MEKQFRKVPIPQTGLKLHHDLPDQQHGWLERLMPGGIRTRLVGLIILAMLPLLLLLAWIFQQRYETRRSQALQTEVEVARGIAATFSTYVEGVHQQNHSVGTAIITGDFREEQIAQLLTEAEKIRPAGRSLNWVSTDGVIRVSSMPDMIGQDLSSQTYFQKVLSGARHVTGDLVPSSIAANRPTFTIATAVTDQYGVLRGVITADIEPTRLNEVVFTQERPAGGTYAIFDRQGTIVYSSPGDRTSWDARVNWRKNDLVLQRVLETGEEQSGLLYPDSSQQDWITARVPVEEIGFIAGARRPEQVALAPVRQNLIYSALFALLVWSMAFGLALLIARTISDSLHHLEQDAHAMGVGRMDTHNDPFAPVEVRRLRSTVQAMASALIQRANALHESESSLREAMLALKESESRFRVLFHNRHSPMLLIDPTSGQIIDANPAASAYYGWSQEELRAIKISEINQLGPNQVQQEMGLALSSGTSRVFLFRHRLASGEIRDVQVSSGPIQVGEKTYLFSIIHDVTERLQAERALQDRSAGMALLSEASTELLAGTDPADMLNKIYPRLSALLHLDVYIHYTLVPGSSYLRLSGAAGIDDMRHGTLDQLNIGESICGRAAETREPIILYDIQNTTDPSVKMLRSFGITSYVCHPLVVHDQLIGTLSFGSRTLKSFDSLSINLIRTTSDLIAAAIYRRQAEARLQLYATRLEESNQELQEFAFIASHDLQEPLRKVEMFGDLIISSGHSLEDTQRDYLMRMRQAAARMRQMILDLLELSRVNSQGRSFERVDLEQAAKDVLTDLEMQVNRTRGKVILQALPVVNADSAQMRQLLQNLIGNALKYHHPQEPPVVRVTGRNITEHLAEIRIEDNGIGFDTSEAERIFLPFQRLVGKSEYEGSGMGLAICRKIIERHHGSISAEPAPGGGSVFIVQLPVNPPNGK